METFPLTWTWTQLLNVGTRFFRCLAGPAYCGFYGHKVLSYCPRQKPSACVYISALKSHKKPKHIRNRWHCLLAAIFFANRFLIVHVALQQDSARVHVSYSFMHSRHTHTHIRRCISTCTSILSFSDHAHWLERNETHTHIVAQTHTHTLASSIATCRQNRQHTLNPTSNVGAYVVTLYNVVNPVVKVNLSTDN